MNKKKVVAIIPARMAASRFPGKPLAKIMGLPMIEHVRRRVCLADILDDVFVATCDNEIKEVVQQYGGKAIMTAKTHERCTDRIEEAAREMSVDIVVIVQGDEPLFDPAVIEVLVRPMLENDSIQCTNLLSLISEINDLADVDIVKAVVDSENYVMYYSRAPIPYFRVKNDCPIYRQTGISAFRKDFLGQFSNLAPTVKEITESIDFLRILEHRHSILGVIYPQKTVGVDRASNIEEVEKILREDQVQQDFYQKIMGMVRC